MAYTINQIFHTSMVLTYAFTLYKTFNLDLPRLHATVPSFDPGMLKFITIWNVILQTIFFLICMLNDWFGTNAVNPKKPPLIRKFKDFLHASLGFPVAMFVSLVFWSLMFIDRELVFPKVLDAHFPWWLNHLLHTMVLISTLMEMVMAPRQYPRRLTSLSAIVILDIIYSIWMHVVHHKTGIWVYPLLSLMSVPVRLIFLVSMTVFTAILYFVGEAINNLVWGNEHNKQQQKSHAKSK